jgi:hypothetical protein
MLKQILTFDVSRILRWDVGRALRTDIMQWRIPPMLLRALAGWVVAGLLLGLTVPFASRRGWPIPEWLPLLMILGCVLAFTLPRRSRH